LAGRLGWPDEVLIDIIGKGLLDKVREEFEKLEKPSTLFEATNIIIGIDKKCFWKVVYATNKKINLMEKCRFIGRETIY